MNRVNLSGIVYIITQPEPCAVVFTEESPVAFRPTRFMLSRSTYSCWIFEQSEGWGRVTCSHIAGAYKWVRENVCDDFGRTPEQWHKAEAEAKERKPLQLAPDTQGEGEKG